MRGLFAAVLGAGALAFAGAARAAAPPPLATPWPQQAGCSRFSGADVSVDDRVRAVEWRGPNGASLVVEVTPAADENKGEQYASGSEGLDCHREMSSCIVYRGGAKVRNVRVARGSQRLPPDFAPGAYTEVVLRDDVRAEPRPRADRGLDFGLRLILRCTDSTKTSLAWRCDAKACVPRTFRDNVKYQKMRIAEETKPRRERHYQPPVDGPYSRRWEYHDANAFGTSICLGRLPGFAEATRNARRVWNNVACARGTDDTWPTVTHADPKPRILELARDLLGELDIAAEEGCAGACSARVDELRATARSLGAAPGLRVTSARAVFDGGNREDREDIGYGAWPSFGWVAKLAAPAGVAEVACAHHQTLDTMGVPEIHACRVSVFARGRHLGDFFPGWVSKIELPDGGAVHLLDPAEHADERPAGGFGDQITVIGSALAQ
jgi:hypothetical protein